MNLFWTDRVWSEPEYFFSSLFPIKSGADLEEVDLSSIERAPLPTDWSGPGWAGGEERGNCCHHNLSRAFLRKSNLQSRFSSTHKKENQSCIHLNTIAKSCLFFHLSYIIFPRSLSCSCLSGVVFLKSQKNGHIMAVVFAEGWYSWWAVWHRKIYKTGFYWLLSIISEQRNNKLEHIGEEQLCWCFVSFSCLKKTDNIH